MFAGQAVSQEQWQAPRTEHGAPDLQGFWTSASITTLERDPALGEKLVVSEEEARQLESANLLNQVTELDNASSDPDRPPPTDGDTDAGYNAFWIDPGTRLARVMGEYRTSFIVDPADGRIPYTEAAGLAFMVTANDPDTTGRNSAPGRTLHGRLRLYRRPADVAGAIQQFLSDRAERGLCHDPGGNESRRPHHQA